MPRIEPWSTREQVPEDRKAEFDAITELRGDVVGPFGVLMWSPGLSYKVADAGLQVRMRSTITPDEKELTTLAVAREKDAEYEWAAHTGMARKAGVRDVAIEAIRTRADVAELAPDERDIINFVRQLLQTNRVSDDLFNALVTRHDLRWVVELTALVGQYQYISAINNVFEVLPPPGAEQLDR